MAGFSSIEGNTFGSVMYADNASFDGTPRNGVISANGELWIGANSAPYVRKNTLTAGTGISITNGAGSITIANSSPGSALTITGNTGGAISPSAGNWNLVTSGTTVKISGSGSTLTQNFGSVNLNLLLGVAGSSISTAVNNVSLGVGSLLSLSTGLSNTAIGTNCMAFVNSGTYNTCIGDNAMNGANGSGCNYNTALGALALNGNLTTADNTAVGYSSLAQLRTGADNTAVGYQSLAQNISGSQNVGLGYRAGYNYTGSESNNISIGYNVNGTVGESNIIRIGTTSHTQTYLQGVVNMPKGQVVAVTAPGAYPYTTLATDYVIIVDTTSARTINLVASPVTGQTYRIKDNTGSAATNNITITPAAGNIDGAASFVINTNYGSVDLVYNGTQWNIL